MSDIVGIGVDMIETERVRKAYEKENFRQKYFTEEERELIAVKAARCATAFAGKEAVAKAMGSGFVGMMPRDIAVLRNEAGAPVVVLTGAARERAESMGISEIKLSLSDTREQAIAYAVAIR